MCISGPTVSGTILFSPSNHALDSSSLSDFSSLSLSSRSGPTYQGTSLSSQTHFSSFLLSSLSQLCGRDEGVGDEGVGDANSKVEGGLAGRDVAAMDGGKDAVGDDLLGKGVAHEVDEGGLGEAGKEGRRRRGCCGCRGPRHSGRGRGHNPGASPKSSETMTKWALPPERVLSYPPLAVVVHLSGRPRSR